MMKKIVVMPVKNEAWVLEKTLTALSVWADTIIIADQRSTDGSTEIYKKFPKVKVVNNSANYHSSNVRKLLLKEARKLPGLNSIFSIDADEIPTAQILNSDFWQKVQSLPPGSAIELQWVQLWRSPVKFRNDKSMWSNSWKAFGFVDDRIMQYDTLNVVNDHTSRVPVASLKNSVRFEQPKILHYQFTNWPRMLSKQCYYRIMEFLKSDKSFFQTMKINLKYLPTRDEKDIKLADLPEQWVRPYRALGIDLQTMKQENLSWYDSEVISLITRNGAASFKWLDIWNVDWEHKSAALQLPASPDLAQAKNYQWFGNLLLALFYQNSSAYKLLKFIKSHVTTKP